MERDSQTTHEHAGHDGIGPHPACVRRVVVVCPDGLAESVAVVPALRHVRFVYAHAHVVAVTGDDGRELLDRCPFVDETCTPGRAHALRAADVALCLAHPSDAATHALLVRVGAATSISWQHADAAGEQSVSPHALHVAVPGQVLREPLAASALRLCRLLGGAHLDPDPAVWTTPADRSAASRLVRSCGDQPLAVVDAALDEPLLVPVLRAIERAGIALVIVGARERRAVTRDAYAHAGVHVLDLVGCIGAAELAGVLERCSLFVGGPGGLAAVATALRVRSVLASRGAALDLAPLVGAVDIADVSGDDGSEMLIGSVALVAASVAASWSAARVP